MNEQKQPYTITVKALLITLVIITVLGLIIGTVAARLETQAFLKKNPQGDRVVQTIQTQTQGASSFFDVIDSEKGNVVRVLDENNNFVQFGTVLTVDGIFITPMIANQKRSISVMLVDGKIISALLVRVYPEKGISFYRAGGSFSAPQFPASETILAGTQGVVVGSTGSSGPTVIPGMVEYFSAEESLDNLIFRERQIVLATRPSNNYLGAPFFDAQRNLLGVVVNTGKGIVLPASEINFLLQDYLKHGAEETVVILSDLNGAWTIHQGLDGKTSPAFKLDTVGKSSDFAKAGLENGDIINSVNDKTFPTVQLWGTLLEGARSGKPVTLGVIRGKDSLKIPILISI